VHEKTARQLGQSNQARGGDAGAKLPLDEMQQRVADGVLQAGPEDRELTERKQRQIVDGASKVLFEKGFGKTSIRESRPPRACRWGSSTTTSRRRTTSST